MAGSETTIVATNRRARRDFEILDTFECGLVLEGSEVKSLRESKVQLAEAYGRIRDHEAWLYSLYIAPYSHASEHSGHDPDRDRKLLLHRSQIDRIEARIDQQRLALVPLSLYFKGGRAKLELAVARRKTKGDKRRTIAERDSELEARRAMARGRDAD